jgi:hypothetical protein
MAVGISATIANAILDSLCRSVNWSDPAAFYVKLHTGDPGSAGATSAATETTRKLATFSAAASGAITTTGNLDWTSVAGTETISHVSFWDASSGGNFLGSDALEVSKALTAGDNFQIAAGDIDLTITPLAA